MKKLKATLKIIWLFLFAFLLLSCEDEMSVNEIVMDNESWEKSLVMKSGTSGYILDLIPIINDFAENGYLNKGNSNSLIRKFRMPVPVLIKTIKLQPLIS